MDMRPTPFLNFDTYSVIFGFAQWSMKYDLPEKYAHFILYPLCQLYTYLQVLSYYLTNFTVLDSLNF